MNNQSTAPQRYAGMYCWAGPGTERMIRLKFPHHKIDRASVWNAYNPDQLQQAQDKLGITDAWVSYSWGFSEQTEQEDYQFLRDRLVNFQRLGIKTHAYVQGTNLVWADHQETDYYCRDHRGRLIPYHRGRRLACPNNPAFRSYLQRKVTLALREAVDGVFVDNIHLGLFPVMLGKKRATFFGCQCTYCQAGFKHEVGEAIPNLFHRQSDLFAAYVEFRVKSLMNLVEGLADQVHAAGRQFGTNSFDPRFDPRLFYGTDIEALVKVQDYLLFENHHLPSRQNSNAYLQPLMETTTKPVFVVSYHRGIGREKQYSQTDLDAVYSESQTLGYAPCYKASEYTTKGVWHNLRLEQLKPVQSVNPQQSKVMMTSNELPQLPGGRYLSKTFNRFYVPTMRGYYENMLIRRSMGWLYYRIAR